MAHSSEQVGGTGGEALPRGTNEQLSQGLSLEDPRTQVYLARLAFPGDATAMNKWLEGEEVQDSLARRYRAYIEDRTCVSADAAVDISDEAALQELLDGVRAHEPERTVH